MKYIIWDLINDYDGYFTTNCNSWDEVKTIMHNRCRELKLNHLYEKWLTGKISRIEKNTVLLFVTTEALNTPVK